MRESHTQQTQFEVLARSEYNEGVSYRKWARCYAPGAPLGREVVQRAGAAIEDGDSSKAALIAR